MAFGILSGPATNPQDTEDNCIPSAFSFPIQWLQVPQWGLVHREEQSKFFKDTMPFPIHFQSTWSKVCILDPQSVGAVVQPLRHVQLFATPWTLAYQASLSFTISLSFLKLLSIESIMPSKHLILCHPPPAFNLSQHQGLFQWVHSSHQVAKVLEFQLQYQFFQWIFKVDFL